MLVAVGVCVEGGDVLVAVAVFTEGDGVLVAVGVLVEDVLVDVGVAGATLSSPSRTCWACVASLSHVTEPPTSMVTTEGLNPLSVMVTWLVVCEAGLCSGCARLTG